MILWLFQCLWMLLLTVSTAADHNNTGSHYPALPVFWANANKTTTLSTDTDCFIRWLTPTKHDFGTIQQGKPVHIIFRFQNEGTQPVMLQTVRSTCGCTAAQWTETAIEPGSEGEIKIEYDAYRRGKFHKKIWVFFDCQKKAFYLNITGKVKI